MKKKKIIIFGATGTLGVNLAIHLNEIGYDVLAVGHRKNDNNFFCDFNIPYCSVDISNKADFDILPQKDVYAVLHFAGALPASMEGYKANLYVSSIIQGTMNVLEYTRLVNADRIVFPQSLFDISYLFGTKVPIPADSLRKAPLDGDHAVYVIAKNAAVDLIEHYYAVYGLKRFIFRLSRIYLYSPNPYTYTDGIKTLISDRFLIYQAMKGKDIEIWGDPNRMLETICIKDFLQIIEKALVASVDGGIYNVGSGGSTLKERVEGIIDVFSPANNKSKIIYCPEKRDTQQFVLDIHKTVNELGYQPQYSWKDYLCDFKKNMIEQPLSKLWGYESDYFDINKY
jgi:UDP-glucose 4-epimerase